MLTPYEVAVKTVIPAIRSMIVREMYVNYGLKQKEIAELLSITQAVVSYYLSHSRGKVANLYENEDVISAVKDVTKHIIDKRPSQFEVAEIIIKLTDEFMRKGYLCKYHKILEPDIIEEECHLCEETADK
jgi:hypothetical protein